jgi:hypothetical protein
MNSNALFASLRFASILGLAGLCGACASMDNVVPSWLGGSSARQNTRPAGKATDENAPEAEKITKLPLSAEDLDCPTIDIPDEQSTLRVGGSDNASVRYQFVIKDTARECQPLGDKFSLKVGVTGQVLVGPAGSPGAFSAPVRLTVVTDVDKKTVYSKTYKIDVDTAGAAEAPFRFVSETIVLPMTRTELNEDYTVSVGFDSGKAAPPAPLHKHKSAKSADAH